MNKNDNQIIKKVLDSNLRNVIHLEENQDDDYSYIYRISPLFFKRSDVESLPKTFQLVKKEKNKDDDLYMFGTPILLKRSDIK